MYLAFVYALEHGRRAVEEAKPGAYGHRQVRILSAKAALRTMPGAATERDVLRACAMGCRVGAHAIRRTKAADVGNAPPMSGNLIMW